MISKEECQELVKQFGKNENDSGSAEVQVAILTKRINNLRPHFQENKHDYHSNRGLLKMIGRRKAFLKYIERKDHDRYLKLINTLGLRK
ncbi:MAG: 30S ribosomal protein S15 [Bdellovibrionales bacterium]|jgi:small subunit ribosomal protein S15|nr:30S ribosomal protein S15 [Bdellovibrionales bacterium]MBT3526227.1 30S ribosomal protein S15 [Bdellovibrionales bacterium]MBT7668755.1 30S ribosomal protein S15 [Bdellovibrionales bacterium]MBT7766843.1 30S ribosomal protein S15 [Bdellovibrionales bacterium]